MSAKSTVQAARERMRPALRALIEMDGSRCMEQSSDPSGIVIERWLLPTGVSVILYGTPDWWDVYAPVAATRRVDDTLAALKALAEQEVQS